MARIPKSVKAIRSRFNFVSGKFPWITGGLIVVGFAIGVASGYLVPVGFFVPTP